MHLPHVSLFNEKINSVLPCIRNIVKIPVRLSSIQKSSEKFLFNEYTVTDTALSDLLRILSIRSSLISEISSDTDQWAPLHSSLANIKIEDKKITRFNDTSIEQEAALNFDKGISYIEGYISTQNENVKTQEVVFNKHTLQLEARFRNSELNIDVFGDNSDL
jgi:hypothetical protein